jgi:hypothetical protein
MSYEFFWILLRHIFVHSTCLAHIVLVHDALRGLPDRDGDSVGTHKPFLSLKLTVVLSVTNVYEERSLGIDDDDEHSEKGGLTHVQKEGGYVKVHIQQQLAYDAWWLIVCIFISESFPLGCISRPLSDGSVVCIADRGKITDSSRYGWFTVFAIIFEVTSAYANVGFSLGVPYVRNPCATFTPPSLILSR